MREHELDDRTLTSRHARHSVRSAIRANDDDRVWLGPAAVTHSSSLIFPLRRTITRVCHREYYFILRFRVQRDVFMPVHRPADGVHSEFHGYVAGDQRTRVVIFTEQ